ncbi:helix-hairpin-helix domain-containing protein, partial [Streptococcus pyogenes]
VNQVGVNVNTASSALLSHIAGLNKTISENIVTYREENGALKTRAQLKKVPRLGDKAFEQAAGFLRIPNGENFLDNTGVH